MNSGENIKIPVSIGELFDKLSILNIKIMNMADSHKLDNVKYEYSLLESIYNGIIEVSENRDQLVKKYVELLKVNNELWTIEDSIRDKERAGDFDSEFIELARSVYIVNDERSRIKYDINSISGSNIFEEKSYKPY
jgi:hypothetical protein